MAAEADILCERRGPLGLVTLNRPQALNALTVPMLARFREALRAWAADDAITRVVVTGAGDRAFCAGGDIRHLYELGQASRFDEALDFFRSEYLLNTAVKQFPKPYVALVNGVCMGGGVGVSVHGTVRVAAERYTLAMPEVGIGLFPDVGATYALPRLPGATGTYLALTGERVRTADALALGLATHAAPASEFPTIIAALADGEPLEAVLPSAPVAAEGGAIVRERALIDRCFAAADVETILARLDEGADAGSSFAQTSAATIRSKSPTSLRIALEQMRRGPGLSFVEAMRTELRIVARVLRGHDFYEGVRAAIIDKDGLPRWRPATLAEIGSEDVARFFADLGPQDLEVA